MILRPIIWLVFIYGFHCHPQRIQIPDLNISRPEEVNSLELEEPLGRSIDPEKNSDNIDETVKEVEDIIKSNPALPRLTRGEILDLLENITNTDKDKILARRKPKAVMVVMPFSPTNDKNMEELFTKAPVTKIIGGEPFKSLDEHPRRRPLVQFDKDPDNDLAKKALPEERKKYSATIRDKATSTQVRRKRPEATTQPTTTYQPTTYHPTSRRPMRRRTTQHPNHRYTEDFVPNQGLRIIEPPKLTSTKYHKNDVSSDLDPQENTKHEVVIKHEPVSASLTNQNGPVFAPLINYQTTTPKTLIQEMNIPENLKNVVKDLKLEEVMSPESERLRAKIAEHNRLKHLLASIGVLAETTTTTTTTTAVPNAENVAESLSPEMRDLLMSFGLLPNPNEKPQQDSDKYYPEKAEVKPESYVGFKPLPDDGPSREGMDALLASFGLGRSARREKSIKTENDQGFNFDMIPDDLRGVISDLGIEHVKRESKKIDAPPVEKQHVFNPDTQYATDEELKKLEKLISMIKQLEKMNGTVTEEDLKKIDIESLKELVSSLNGQNETLETLEEKQNSPDPTTFDVGVVKNEVKRQESSTTTEAVTVTVATEATTVVEAETPSLKDLEESFGGSTEVVTEPPIPETTTKRTGFYYLVDWNTFLDIDDTKGKRVNLRFQPTIGDPKRFLSVSVP